MDLGNIYDAETDDEDQNPPKPRTRKQVKQQKEREVTQRNNGASSKKAAVVECSSAATPGNKFDNQAGLRRYRSARKQTSEQAINELLTRTVGGNTTMDTLMTPEQPTGRDLIEFLQKRTPNFLFQAPSASSQRAAETGPLFFRPVTQPSPSSILNPVQNHPLPSQPVQYAPLEAEILNSGPGVQIGNTRFPNLRSALASASKLIPSDPGPRSGDGRNHLSSTFQPSFINRYPYYDDSTRYANESLPTAYFRVTNARKQLSIITRQIPLATPSQLPGESAESHLRRNQEARAEALRQDEVHKRKLNPLSEEYNGRYENIWRAQQKWIGEYNKRQREVGLRFRREMDWILARPAGPDPVVDGELSEDLFDFSWFEVVGRPVELGAGEEAAPSQHAGEENRTRQEGGMLAGPSMAGVALLDVSSHLAMPYDDCKNCQRHGRQCQESRPCFECCKHNLVCTGSFLEDLLASQSAFEEAFYELAGDAGSDGLGYGDPMDSE